ncbi:hypothetical protein LTS17_004281 [Exophiala oligosperma]
MPELGDALFLLSHYRWRGSGSGIIKLTAAGAAREWNHPGVEWRCPLVLSSAVTGSGFRPSRGAVEAICNPSTRVCMQGYFDLSISVALSQTTTPGLQHELQSLCYPLGSTLDGSNNQSFRRFIRRCHIAFEAINGSETPILQLTLPYVLGWPTILHGMLALSINPSKRTSREFNYHQAALTELRTEIGKIYNGILDTATVHKTLCTSFLLAMFSLADCDGCWAQHVRGMVSIIRMADWNSLQSSKLGTFLVSACAHQDISAFGVGRLQSSKRCWLAWMSHKVSGTEDVLSAFEIMVGYPESLIDIIARVAEAAEDETTFVLQGQQYEEEISLSRPGTLSSCIEAQSRYALTALFLGIAAHEHNREELEESLASWTAPPLPSHLPDVAKLILPVAWETIRHAAFIYLWRAQGFHSNVLEPFRPDRKRKRDLYVRQIISNTRMIMRLAVTQRVSVGNAMLWPLTVAGCECGDDSMKCHQPEIMDLLHSLHGLFSMDHTARVKELLQRLWERQMSEVVNQSSIAGHPKVLSLERMARERQLTVPLL